MALCHNAPALPAPSRRNFIVGAVGTAGIALAGSHTLAMAEPDAQILNLYRQRIALDAHHSSLADQADTLMIAKLDRSAVEAEQEKVLGEMCRVEAEMAAIPAAGAAGILAKLKIYDDVAMVSLSDREDSHVSAFLSAMQDLERLAGASTQLLVSPTAEA